MSPRKITVDMTFETLESEVMYTIAALGADSDAAPKLPETDQWFDWIDALRKQDRAFRQEEANVDATRVVANLHLDATCVAFGQRLLGLCNQDRTALRFTRFFPKAPYAFIRQALHKQIAGVMGWLGQSDEALEPFRVELQARATRARDALDATAALHPKRGAVDGARAQLAEDFTRDRDALHRELQQIAADKSLPRDWADAFFRSSSKRSDEPEPTPPTPT